MSNDYITPQEREEYGEEFLAVVGKQARAATAAELAQVKHATATVQQELHKVKVAEMKKHMDARLPEWRSQNSDPGFLEWLGQRDQFSGMSRHQLLTDAWNSGAVDRVLAIFQGYRSGAQRPVQHQGGNAAPSSQVPHGVLWPLGHRGAISQQQIANYHRMVIEGRFTPQEKQQRDAEMVAAAREGRVVN